MSNPSGPSMKATLRATGHRLKVAAHALRASAPQTFPPGHFYSPVADVSEVRARHGAIFDRTVKELPGVDSNEESQLALLARFTPHVADLPFGDAPTAELRYGFDNSYFSYGDGLALYCMLREFRPRRIVEVGSGWSSAMMLDVNDRFLGGETEMTFIEPFPDRLNELLRPEDRARTTIIETGVQTVEDAVFHQLEAGDLLFIDSTHVSRVGSDVNHLLLHVLPQLPAGVHVHIHDVFWPFEYPEDWVYAGRGWTEDYLLRALLINNNRLAITWFNSFMAQFHADRLAAVTPLWPRNPGGSVYLTTS